jgi:hypothetical protein
MYSSRFARRPFYGVCCNELYLEVVEVLVQALELPVSAILHLAFNDEPEDVVGEAVSRYAGFDRGKVLALTSLHGKRSGT